MDLKAFSKIVLMMTCLELHTAEIQQIEARSSIYPPRPVLGTDKLTLRCNITLSSSQHLVGVNLSRKRPGDHDFSVIAMFLPGRNANVTYVDVSLTSRTVADKVEDGGVTTASFTFNGTQCGDTAQYKWVVSYYWNMYYIIERISDVKINVPGTFPGASDYGITVLPGTVVKEGTTVTVKCKADVGSNPVGRLAMYYFLDGSLHQFHPAVLTTGPLSPVRACSYAQETELYMPMTRKWNGMWFRCVLQQNASTEFGDDYRQSNPVNVTYSPSNVVITSNPHHQVYTEGKPSC